MKRIAVPPVDRLPEAWRILGLTNDWIKHVETKAGLTMAAGAGLLSLLAGSVLTAAKLPGIATPVGLAAGVCLLAGLVSGVCALWPRRTSAGAAPTLVFFGHISSYAGDAAGYTAALDRLMRSPDDLFAEVTAQIVANAEVARRKYQWTGRALACIVTGLGFIAVLVATVLITRPS